MSKLVGQTLMLAHDFAFHSIQHQHQKQQQPMTLNNQAPFQRQMTFLTMQHLSIGASIQQQEPSYQLNHIHHGSHRETLLLPRAGASRCLTLRVV